MLAHADEIDANLVCQDSLIDYVPNDAWLGQHAAVVVMVTSPKVSRPSSTWSIQIRTYRIASRFRSL